MSPPPLPSDVAFPPRLTERMPDSIEQVVARALEAESAQVLDPTCANRWQAQVDAALARINPAPLRLARPSKARKVPIAETIKQNHTRRLAGLEETVLELYHANLSLHRAEGLAATLWVQPVTLAFVQTQRQALASRITRWLLRELDSDYRAVFFASIELNASRDPHPTWPVLLLAVGVNQRGFRETLGIFATRSDEAASWTKFLHQLRERGLQRTQLAVGAPDPALRNALDAQWPGTSFQGCIVHLHREVLHRVPPAQTYLALAALTNIHASAQPGDAVERIAAATQHLHAIGLGDAAEFLAEHGPATLTCFALPPDQRRRVNTVEPLQKILREFRERARLLGYHVDGDTAALMLGARLRHIARLTWFRRRHLCAERTKAAS